MSEIGFPLKDLKRRKTQTGLTILGLTIATSATVFLVVFGDNLGFEIAFLTVGRLTSGFSNIFSRFVLVVGFLNILAGALTTTFLVYLTMSDRRRDVGVMKASGCLSGSIFGYFITELSILIFLSCLAGTGFGIVAYYISFFLLNVLGFSVSQSLSLWTVLLTILILIIVSHVSGALPIAKAAKVKPAEALSPLYSLGTTFEFGKTVSSKLGFTFKVTYRNLVRRKSATLQAIICLVVVLTLTTVTLAGGVIASQTTTNYVERAVGRDVVLVGHPNLTGRYVNFLSQFFEPEEMKPIEYLDSDFIIPQHLVHKMSGIPGVRKVDPRIVLEVSVLEIPGIIPDPTDPNEAIVIGDSRHDAALILGVEPDRVVNEWLIMGRGLDKMDQESTIIGDSLALEIFDSPQNQSIKILDRSYGIVGVCLDPLNNGKVVYMPLNELSSVLGQSGYNLVFLKIDQSDNSFVLSELKKEISGENLNLVSLNDTLNKHVDFLNNIWSLVKFLPLTSLVTAILCLLSYLMLFIAGQQREFGVMRALGAKPKSIMKIVVMQALVITLVSAAIGVSVGLFITFVFLIPEPVISQYTLVSVAEWLLLALGLLCLSSLYPAAKAVRKSVVNALYSF